MDSEGYPDEFELERIEKWDVKDFPSLLEYVESLHIYKNYIKREVIKEDYDSNRLLLKWSFSTGGWSGNESLIYALLKNFSFRAMWYHSWQRGGRYVFHIDPQQVGFKLIRDYCAENRVSRQYISKVKDKFDIFKLAPSKTFIRKKACK